MRLGLLVIIYTIPFALIYVLRLTFADHIAMLLNLLTMIGLIVWSFYAFKYLRIAGISVAWTTGLSILPLLIYSGSINRYLHGVTISQYPLYQDPVYIMDIIEDSKIAIVQLAMALWVYPLGMYIYLLIKTKNIKGVENNKGSSNNN